MEAAMTEVSLKYYTDASYSPQTGFGVIAIRKVVNSNMITDSTTTYHGIKNSELEKIGIEICIRDAQEQCNTTGSMIHVFTDCESSISNYESEINLKVHWIQGHLAKKNRISEDDRHFREVDLKARKELRKLVSIHNLNSK